MLLEVTDNGEGIPADKIQEIYNLEYSTRRKGWGLGLYLTKLIVNKHQGEIVIESEIGKGTKVIINLPIHVQGDSNGNENKDIIR